MSTRHSFLSTTGLVRKASATPSTAPLTIHAESGGTKTGSRLSALVKLNRHGGVFPMSPKFLVGLAVAFSLMFIVSISMAFVGEEDEESPFKGYLENIAHNDPGIVLIGDSVNIDVDEPAVTIRWTIIGCGNGFVLSGSEGTHGTMLCGMPSMGLNIYVDSEPIAVATYDPDQFPVSNATNKRLEVQDLVQFDSDHVLNVQEARLYPFDDYHLTSTLRATLSEGNVSMPIQALTTIKMTSSFVVSPTDISSYMITSPTSTTPSRDIELHIKRPGEARIYAILLFATNWMLAHATIGMVVLAWNPEDSDRLLRYLGLAFGMLFIIPQLRSTMPDAPGYDGVLLDSIGFFPQMLVSGISSICLLVMVARRDLARPKDTPRKPEDAEEDVWVPPAKGLQRLRRIGTSGDFRSVRFSRSFSKADAPVRQNGPGGGWAAFN